MARKYKKNKPGQQQSCGTNIALCNKKVYKACAQQLESNKNTALKVLCGAFCVIQHKKDLRCQQEKELVNKQNKIDENKKNLEQQKKEKPSATRRSRKRRRGKRSIEKKIKAFKQKIDAMEKEVAERQKEIQIDSRKMTSQVNVLLKTKKYQAKIKQLNTHLEFEMATLMALPKQYQHAEVIGDKVKAQWQNIIEITEDLIVEEAKEAFEKKKNKWLAKQAGKTVMKVGIASTGVLAVISGVWTIYDLWQLDDLYDQFKKNKKKIRESVDRAKKILNRKFVYEYNPDIVEFSKGSEFKKMLRIYDFKFSYCGSAKDKPSRKQMDFPKKLWKEKALNHKKMQEVSKAECQCQVECGQIF